MRGLDKGGYVLGEEGEVIAFVGAWWCPMGIAIVACVAKKIPGMCWCLLIEFCALAILEFKYLTVLRVRMHVHVESIMY